MNAADAVLMATWCAACAVALIQPAMTGTTAKMPTSLRLCSPAGQPVVSKRRKTASWRPSPQRTSPRPGVYQRPTSIRIRETSVAQPAPARPIAGKPQWPNIHSQLKKMLARMPAANQAREIHGWCCESRCPRSAWKARPGTMAQAMMTKKSCVSAVTSGDEPSSGRNCAAACVSAAVTTPRASASTMPCRRIAGADSSTPAPLSCD